MGDGTSLLFGLDGFRVVSVSRSAIGVRQVLIEGVAPEQACPDCGVFSAQVHARWTQQIKDLPYGAALVVCWIRRRFRCDEDRCGRRTLESGANRGRLRGNGEPGWRAFDGVGEAGVPAAELVGEVVVEHTGADLKE